MEISAAIPTLSGAFARLLQALRAKLSELWRSRHKQRSLRVCETAGLGERRFVAVLQFERQRFLIGGGPGSVTLLAQLAEKESTGDFSE